VRAHMSSFARRLLARHRSLRVAVIVTSIVGGRSVRGTRTVTLRG
jgi:hypothetical protein